MWNTIKKYLKASPAYTRWLVIRINNLFISLVELLYEITHWSSSVVYKMKKDKVAEWTIAKVIFNYMLEKGYIRTGCQFLYGGCYSICGVFFVYKLQDIPITYSSVRW